MYLRIFYFKLAYTLKPPRSSQTALPLRFGGYVGFYFGGAPRAFQKVNGIQNPSSPGKAGGAYALLLELLARLVVLLQDFLKESRIVLLDDLQIVQRRCRSSRNRACLFRGIRTQRLNHFAK